MAPAATHNDDARRTLFVYRSGQVVGLANRRAVRQPAAPFLFQFSSPTILRHRERAGEPAVALQR
ncbi:MAG: hypothetical protein D6761_12580 [Candidatus Dadabacteria bacterium]|nr:MAG: hypothetical protein D6761_12580 [Candidatus Dadabacteria bacterium]